MDIQIPKDRQSKIELAKALLAGQHIPKNPRSYPCFVHTGGGDGGGYFEVLGDDGFSEMMNEVEFEQHLISRGLDSGDYILFK